MFSAVRHGKKNDIMNALERGCPVELKDDHGMTACFWLADGSGSPPSSRTPLSVPPPLPSFPLFALADDSFCSAAPWLDKVQPHA